MDPLEPWLKAIERYNLLTSWQFRHLGRIAREFAEVEEFFQKLERLGWLTAYQAAHLRRGQGDRLVVGPYILLEPLDGGGMGQVFRARHCLLERVVAHKRIRPDHQGKPQTKERFLREVRAVAGLTHPNIVTVYDFFQEGDKFYLSMEMIQGTDLHSYLDRHGPLPVALACDYTYLMNDSYNSRPATLRIPDPI